MNMYFLKLILEQKEKAYSDANMFCKINSVSKSMNMSTRSAPNTMDDSSALSGSNSRMSDMSDMSDMVYPSLSGSNSRMSGMSDMVSPSLSGSNSQMSDMSDMDSLSLSDSNSTRSKPQTTHI